VSGGEGLRPQTLLGPNDDTELVKWRGDSQNEREGGGIDVRSPRSLLNNIATLQPALCTVRCAYVFFFFFRHIWLPGSPRRALPHSHCRSTLGIVFGERDLVWRIPPFSSIRWKVLDRVDNESYDKEPPGLSDSPTAEPRLIDVHTALFLCCFYSRFCFLLSKPLTQAPNRLLTLPQAPLQRQSCSCRSHAHETHTPRYPKCECLILLQLWSLGGRCLSAVLSRRP
jgi:hypothetical protein